VVTIPAAVLPDVRAHLERYVGPEPTAVVFTGPVGGRLPGGAFASSFAAACGRLGLTGVRFHDLRHTGNTLAASTGASLTDLMARMGHASGEAALRYQHATRAQDAAVAASLSALVEAARERRTRGDGVPPVDRS
jgi:integrase